MYVDKKFAADTVMANYAELSDDPDIRSLGCDVRTKGVHDAWAELKTQDTINTWTLSINYTSRRTEALVTMTDPNNKFKLLREFNDALDQSAAQRSTHYKD